MGLAYKFIYEEHYPQEKISRKSFERSFFFLRWSKRKKSLITASNTTSTTVSRKQMEKFFRLLFPLSQPALKKFKVDCSL